MPSMSNLKSDAVFALFKGEPGTRKSTAALSFFTVGDMYWASFDRKMNSLLLPGRKWGVDFTKIDYDDFDDYNAAIRKFNALQTNNKYKTIVIDSITSEADAINRQTMKFKSGTTNKEGGEKGLRVGGIPVNSMEDYKAENSAFQETIAVLKDIKEHFNCNIILIAHVIGDRANQGHTHFARIICTGGKAISAKIPAYCDEVYHFNVEGNADITRPPDYGLYTIHSGDDFARTALPLPNKIMFNDEQLYSKWIKPAIDKLNGDVK